MLEEHPDELRADFQETYGLDLDRMGEGFSTLHAASLLAQLPAGARVWAAYEPQAVWTLDRTLGAAAVNALNLLVWMRTKDGRRGRNRPKPVGPFRDPRTRRKRGLAMTAEEMRAFLAQPREEAGGGQH